MEKEALERKLADWKPNCYCKEGEKFCGECEECGKPGHTQHCPLPIPYTGSWCNECAKKIIRLDNEGLTPKEIFLILEREAKKIVKTQRTTVNLKNVKFITDPDSKQNVEVTLIPLGNKIKYRLTGKVYCSRQNSEIQNSGTFSVDDLVWNAVFGRRIATKKFIKNNRALKKIMPISYLGYEQCDSIK